MFGFRIALLLALGLFMSGSILSAASEPKGGGRYEVVGKSTGALAGSSVADIGEVENNEPVEFDWPVARESYEKLKVGMTLDEAREALGLSKLVWTPKTSTSEFRMTCVSGSIKVKLVFTGTTTIKLTEKSAKGYK